LTGAVYAVDAADAALIGDAHDPVVVGGVTFDARVARTSVAQDTAYEQTGYARL
jgi:hypothetical protein